MSCQTTSNNEFNDSKKLKDGLNDGSIHPDIIEFDPIIVSANKYNSNNNTPTILSPSIGNTGAMIPSAPNPKKDDDKDKNDKKNDENNINKILSNSKRLPNTSTKLQQFEKSGGYKQAQKDFETLKLKNITTSKSSDGSLVKIGELSDGTKVNIRTKSSYGSSATLEIQGKNPIKIRYN